MSIRNLDALFKPRSIALIGASNEAAKVGRVIADNLFNGGFSGPIMPVSPHHPVVRGVISYADVASLPPHARSGGGGHAGSDDPGPGRRTGGAWHPRAGGDLDRFRWCGRLARRPAQAGAARRRATALHAHRRAQLPQGCWCRAAASTPASPT